MLALAILLVSMATIVVVTALLPVRTDYRVSITGDRQEGLLESSSGLFHLKLCAVKEGELKEASVDISVAGRLAIYRVDYPIVKMSRHGRWPVVKVHREVEVGTGSASPVAKEDKEYGVMSLLRMVEETRLVAQSLASQIRRLGSHTTVSDVSLLVHESTGSPETTALAFGALWGLIGYGLSTLHRHTRLVSEPSVDIQPIYGQPYLVLRGCGHTSVRQFHLFVFLITSLSDLWPRVWRYIKLYMGLRRLKKRFSAQECAQTG